MADDSRIRLMTVDDLGEVLRWRNHPDVRKCMLTRHEIQPAEHAAWFARASVDPARRLMIVEDSGGPLGFVHFSGVAPGKAADWGFYACPAAVKGSGRRLGCCALAFAFDTLGLHKVCGQALDFNTASIGFHEALGFRREGVLREQHKIDDRYHDLVCFGLLGDEWRTAQQR